MAAYYNEFDPFAAEWLKSLISRGLIAPGEVDDRSIRDVRPDDLRGFTQCHFFAGLGGWSYALRLAGWSDDAPVWTGSCPCQPYSSAGEGKGDADPRNLWPDFFRLIRECRPDIVFGEQVAAAIGHGWLDGISGDLEGEGYACGAVVLGAHSVGAPHIRQRLYWVADARRESDERRRIAGVVAGESGDTQDETRERQRCWNANCDCGATLPVAVANLPELRGVAPAGELPVLEQGGGSDGLGESIGPRLERHAGNVNDGHEPGRIDPDPMRSTPETGGATDAWSDFTAIACRDGKARRIPTESLLQPLAPRLSDCLDSMRSIENAAWKEIENYGSHYQTDTSEILRILRDYLRAEANWKEEGTGVCVQLPSPQVLLDFLFCAESAQNGTSERSGISEACSEARERLLRSLWENSGDRRASRRWKPAEQRREQPADSLLSLSFVLAWHAEAYREAAFRSHAASRRTGLLKGYGNAIVPQVAAEFVRAWMEREQGGQP